MNLPIIYQVKAMVDERWKHNLKTEAVCLPGWAEKALEKEVRTIYNQFPDTLAVSTYRPQDRGNGILYWGAFEGVDIYTSRNNP